MIFYECFVKIGFADVMIFGGFVCAVNCIFILFYITDILWCYFMDMTGSVF